MELHNLIKIVDRRKKRVGRGHGCGKVKTAGRGTKGTKARYTVPLTFEGGALPLKKRIPFLRGKLRFKPLMPKMLVINVEELNNAKDNDLIDNQYLVAKGLIQEKELEKRAVKILGKGELRRKLTVKLPVSQKAKEKIESAGGKVESV